MRGACGCLWAPVGNRDRLWAVSGDWVCVLTVPRRGLAQYSVRCPAGIGFDVLCGLAIEPIIAQNDILAVAGDKPIFLIKTERMGVIERAGLDFNMCGAGLNGRA